ncbi:uncharacterized protein C8Q71DRAFT_123863 [Rhodofomes roseus]|uniref:BTB domain-containing protein n=1 Tax=Rhodofomes roseus TaxID=34475 RepID=A0ABQ8KBG9_9APHY|nr:uncharacterized protein C8Q71DRAFT_123863 [Rhodofomes roseus]KAH9834778.1 hypothetical protein C8Q71DRAFT_123863 [Rhodofomes roseus]
MQPLQIEIPESLVPLPTTYSTSRSSSSPPSSWVNHSPARHVSALPSPVSPILVHTELSPIHSEQDSTTDHTESHQSEDPSPPKQYVEVETPSPSVASLVEFAGNRASRTDLMNLVIVPHSPAVPFVAPVPPRSHRRTARRPRAHTTPSRPESPISTPPSAAALSSSMTCPPDDAQPKDRSSQAITSSKSKSEPPRSAVRPSFHDMFYIRDEMVVISVEGCLYRVHRHLLEHNSDFFRRLFFEGAKDGRNLGASDESAITLPDVSQHDLDCLLNFLYFRIFEDDALSLRDWVTLLDISSRLRFSKLRSRSIREISSRRDSLTAVETIVLAHKHDVPVWLAKAYGDLCRRPHPLDDAEADQLGAKITARIARARETIRDETFRAVYQTRSVNRAALPDTFDDELVSRTVMDVFWLGE